MSATPAMQITARIYAKCPVLACLVVDVPADPTDLFPDCFSLTTVIVCQHCRDAAEARRERDDNRRAAETRAEEDAAAA